MAYRRRVGVETGPLIVSRADGSAARVIAANATYVQGWANNDQLIYEERVGRETRITIARTDSAARTPATLSWSSDRGFFGPITLSPDGKNVTFLREWGDGLAGTLRVSLNIMRSDGSGSHELYRGQNAYGSRPEALWEPGGKTILVWEETGAVFRINRDGSNLRQLPVTEGVWGPMLSPDGKMIVFASTRNGRASANDTSPPSDVYVMNADGGRQRQLSVAEIDSAPTWADGSTPGAWSPDGEAIAFKHNHEAGIVRVDGSARRTICPASVAGNTIYRPVAWRQ